MQVIVVGAGLGGLAAALAVHRAGHEVEVLERAPELRESGAGIGIMPNGVLALDALGLGVEVRALAAPLDTGGGFRDRHGRALLAADQAALRERTGAPLAVVPRRWLHALLADGLPAGSVRTGCPVDTLAEPSGRADAVVVADGAGSRLRAALFPDHPGLAGSGEHVARAIAPVAPAGVALVAGELLDHRTGERFGCLPMAGGGVYWYASWPAGVGVAQDAAGWHRWLRERRADWHPVVGAVIDATPPAHVHVVETVQLSRPLPALAVGKIALVGDAAHAMTPDLGQGAGQAFEDAVVLGAVLRGTVPGGVVDALLRYSRRRAPRTAALQQATRRTHRLLTSHGLRARLRDGVLRSVPTPLATRALAAQLHFDPEDGPTRV